MRISFKEEEVSVLVITSVKDSSLQACTTDLASTEDVCRGEVDVEMSENMHSLVTCLF